MIVGGEAEPGPIAAEDAPESIGVEEAMDGGADEGATAREAVIVVRLDGVANGPSVEERADRPGDGRRPDHGGLAQRSLQIVGEPDDAGFERLVVVVVESGQDVGVDGRRPARRFRRLARLDGQGDAAVE